MWFYFFAPALVALLLMVVFSVVALDRLVTQLAEQPPATWLTAWGAEWLGGALATLGAWLLMLSASYLVAMLLTAIVVLPLLLNHLPPAITRISLGATASSPAPGTASSPRCCSLSAGCRRCRCG